MSIGSGGRLAAGVRAMTTAKDSFPSVWQAVLLLVADFVLQFVAWALLYAFRRPLGLSEPQIVPLAMVLGYGLLLVPVMHYRGMTYRDLVHWSPSSPSATLGLLLPPVLLLVPLLLLLDQLAMSYVTELVPLSSADERKFARMVDGTLPMMIAACVLAPVLEEMLFRGVLLRAFLHRYPRWPAIAGSALLFGLAHLNVYQFVVAFFLGLLAGWLVERSRSLLPAIALHAALNTSIVLLQGQEVDAGPSTWLLALMAGAAGAWVLWRVLVAPAERRADAT